MATDGPTPPDCDQDIYENGEHVFTTDTIPPNAMDGWVKKVAKLSGQRVDWHFVGGRAVVRALGDITKIKKAIAKLMPEHDRLHLDACRKIRP
ncbi:MAG: hypothetical protein AAB554_00275 [Patescibacteria group bacterium]